MSEYHEAKPVSVLIAPDNDQRVHTGVWHPDENFTLLSVSFGGGIHPLLKMPYVNPALATFGYN